MDFHVKQALCGGLVAVSIASSCILVGCNSSTPASSESEQAQTINVYSREDGSGTRGAFVELIGLEDTDSSGNKIDCTTDSASITNSTSVMMTSVAEDDNGIGYISLGSLNDSVKALDIDGVTPSAENILAGDYTIARPFNLITNADKEMDDVTQDFVNFILSKDGQEIIADNGFIPIKSDSDSYTPTALTGKVSVAGSSSVYPVMEKLQEAYCSINPNIEVEVQQSDSTTGINLAIDGTCNLGMASRDLKDSEIEQGAQNITIARDGIAVIVSPNSSLKNITKENVRDVFNGTITSWDELS